MVLDQVVRRGWCVGCGMCVAVCPKNRLEIRWNDRGEHNPAEVDGCADCDKNCNLCYSVCPAHGNTKNETEIGRELYGNVDGIKHRDETGYFLASYVGFADRDGLRENGASGGMATWTLESLINSGEVDAVAAVGRTTNPEKLFEFRICATVDEIRQCSRSAYYPVETSQVIRHILEHDGRYAIIGLPCVCKAIRLAQEKFPKLKQRIRYVLGLTCGHSCSKYLAEYLCALGGGDPHDIREFVFRVKDPSQPASNYGSSFRSGNMETNKTGGIRWRDGWGFAFQNGYFQIPGCFYCDDIFAECADVAFMDAWLPGYSNQPEGHSIVLVRDLRIDGILADSLKEGVSIKPLSAEQTIQSQMGVVKRKRLRMTSVSKDPKRRTKLIRQPQLHHRPLKYWSDLCAQTSSDQWIQSNKDYALFTEAMQPLRRKITVFQKVMSVPYLPLRIYRKTLRIILRNKKK